MSLGKFTGDSSSPAPGISDETGNRDVPGDVAGHAFADEFLAELDRVSAGTQVEDGNCVRVLDVGTGTARIPIAICLRRRGIMVTAIDRGARVLQSAGQNVEQAGLTGAIRIEKADAISLPFANAAFDAVISSSLLHHVSNRHGALTEMMRVLRPGGLLMVRDTLRGSDARQIAEILSCSSRDTQDVRQTAFQRTFQATLSLEEARDLAFAAGLPSECVRQSGPRHWMLEFRLQPAPVEVNHSRRPPAQVKA